MNGTGGVISVPPKPAPKPAAKPPGKKPSPLLKSLSDGSLLSRPSNGPPIPSHKPGLQPSPKPAPLISPKPKVPRPVSGHHVASPPVVAPRPRSHSKPQIHAPSSNNEPNLVNGGPPPTDPKPTKPKPPTPARKSFVPPPSPSVGGTTGQENNEPSDTLGLSKNSSVSSDHAGQEHCNSESSNSFVGCETQSNSELQRTVTPDNSESAIVENSGNQGQLNSSEPGKQTYDSEDIECEEIRVSGESKESATEDNQEFTANSSRPFVTDEDKEQTLQVITEDTRDSVRASEVQVEFEDSPVAIGVSDDQSLEPESPEAPEATEISPPVPAPRSSVSSVASVNSSIDSYDLINAGSSFKSHRSTNSVRSEASTRHGSDSEEEFGVFEINDSIVEEDEEDSDTEESLDSTVATPEPSEAEESHSVSEEIHWANPPDIEEDKVNETGVLLVSVSADIPGAGESSKDTDSELVAELNPGEECVVRSVEDSVGVVVTDSQEQYITEVPSEDREEVPSEAGALTTISANDSIPGSDDTLVSSPGREQDFTRPISTTSKLSGICGEYLVVPEKSTVTEEPEDDTTESDQEEDEVSEEEEEGEVELDEMGKRVFSLSRKKKSGVLKYSSGEFHEQYEGAGKDKASPDKGKKSKQKKKQKKGKREEEEKKSSLSNFKPDLTENCGDAVDPLSEDEERPSKPPRLCPEATPSELELKRLSEASDASASAHQSRDVDAETPPPSSKPSPAPRLSLSRPVPCPRASVSHRHASESEGEDTHGFSSTTPTQTSDYSQDEGDQVISNADDVFAGEDHSYCGGLGAVVTRLDTDGEEEVIIGGMPSSSTQTAFADQASINSSSAEASMAEDLPATEVPLVRCNDGDQRRFRHYATIEPVNGTSQENTAVAATSSQPISATTSLSENQSITISITGSEEPLSDSTEYLSHDSEHALNKPWTGVAAVTVAMSTMPQPLVPEYTQVMEDSASTTSSASSLVPGKTAENQEELSEDQASDGQLFDEEEDDDEDDDDEKGGNMYDKVKIYDDSYTKKDWKYIESKDEMAVLVQPIPDNDEEAEEAKDTVSEISESSSLATTASEVEFRASFGMRPHRIQRRRGTEDYVRLSRISRERTIKLFRKDGTFGLRIQKSKPVVVTSLDKEGPAEKAGLKIGDMILSVNGVDVRNSRHSEVVKLATEVPEPLCLVVGTVVCNSLNIADDKIVMSGYMHKLASTGMIKQWRRRWFVLKQDNCLYYYKTETDVVPQGAIVLQNYIVTKARDSGKQFCFKLTKEGARTYFFYTTDNEEMSSWGKAINEAANPSQQTDIWMDISTHNVGLPALSLKDPECQGYINKFNSKMRSQKRRYCVLKDACLYYYKDMSAMSAQGVVHLHGYNIQETELKGKKYAFILKPPEEDLREFYFFANHDVDRKRWVAALASSIGRWVQTNATDDGDDDGTEMLI